MSEPPESVRPPAPPSRTAPQFVVRLPSEAFRDRIAEAAKVSNRSMNAEIVARLEQSFDGPNEPYATQSQLERVFARIRANQDEFLMAVTLLRDMLGSYVVRLYNALPVEKQRDIEFMTMRDLARAAIDMDADGMRDSAARIMSGVKEMRDIGVDPTTFFQFLADANKEGSKRRREMLDRESPKPNADPSPEV